MLTRRTTLLAATSSLGLAGLGLGRPARAAEAARFPVAHTEGEWRHQLTPAQFAILRQAGTEAPGSSPLAHEVRPGRYDCAGCRQRLFSSATKFDSGTGWPSFWQALPRAVVTSGDSSLGTSRTEVRCANCGGHLGHVFDDGPKPTGLRYCMNGAVLTFQPVAA